MAGPGLFGTIAAGYGAVQQGRRAGEERRRAELLQNYALQLQQEKEQRAAAQGERDFGLRQRQVGVQERTAAATEAANEWRRQNPTPRNIDPLSPAGITARTQAAEAEARARAKYRAPSPGSQPPRPETLLDERAKFADRFLQAAGGDPQRAMQMAATSQGDYALASRLGMTRYDYGAAAQRFKAAQQRAAGTKKTGAIDINAIVRDELGGGAPAPARNAVPVTPGSTGHITLAAPAAGPKPVPAADAEKARTDPAFAAWLRDQGYAVPE